MNSKRALSETDICDRFITPALHQAGWLRERILREHSFTDGRIIVRGRLVSRGRRRRADYLLNHEGVPLAVIEAKDNTHSMGDGFVFHDGTGQGEERETTLALEAFPSPAELWQRYSRWRGFTPQQERVALQPY